MVRKFQRKPIKYKNNNEIKTPKSGEGKKKNQKTTR